jgi:hypothetical protein
MTPNPKQHWSERFDEEFTHRLHIATHDKENYSGLGIQVDGEWEFIKQFIQTVEKEAVERTLKEIKNEIPERDGLTAHTELHQTFQDGANWALLHTHALLDRKLETLEPHSSKESEEKV